ncbi:hypothetical protein EW026_g884 [Hermanssonia centrifuga]|uniref:Transcription factor domain-containing protein n=1 Tax=Hermanssonia centrifuga TaxID=98765 RepID=A0A4S4KXW8_9APHY|nr:hypothetical protein EW026_g884 [Hermanssonia centrifuga]
MAAHVSTPSTVATNGVLNPMLTQIQGPNALTSAEALTRAPAENRSNVFGKPDLYHGAQQQHGIAQTDTLNSNSSSHAASVRHISHHSDALQRIVTVNEPQFPQVPVHASPLQQYSPISTPLSDLTYVGYLPVPVSAISCVADEYDDDAERKPEIGAEPSLQFARETWWDTLLGLYSMQVQPQGGSVSILTPGRRDSVSQQITSDLRFLFKASNYWFSFVNVPRFFARLMDPVTRSRLQPSLVLAAVAVANFIRSSEQENGEKGRTWALTLRDRAQSALEASLNARWVDESLVQASWLIAFFEISAHPLHSAVRVRSSLSMLDSLVRSLAMPSLDQDDHRASVFASHTVPTVVSSPSVSPPISPWNSRLPQPVSAARPSSPPGECACAAYTLGNNWSHAQELTPLWLMTPAWNRDSSDAEVRKEESRRVVWSAVTLVAGYTSYTSASNPLPTMDLFLMNAANYALLFPGESLVATSTGPSRKETVWALYMRTMLLWHTCIRMRSNTILGDPEKAQFAVSAWLEVDKIEEALNSHTCGIERAFLFQGREYLFKNSNLLFHRKKAEEWLTHQASVAKRTMYGLQTITGQPNVSLARRPFFIFWFMSQVNRALLLWSCDNTLTIALDVSKALLGPIEYMMSMWPCPEQQKRYQDLRANLSNACYLAGVPPPSPMNVSSHLPRS